MLSTPPDERVPLFPLGTVLHPGGQLPLRIFEPRYVDLVGSSLRTNRPFGIVPITRGREVGAPAEFHPLGTLVHITAWDQGQDGLLHIQVCAAERFRVLAHEVGADGLVRARCEALAPARDGPLHPRHAWLARLLQEIFEQNREQVPYDDWTLDSAAWVARRLGEVLPLPLATRIAILEADDGTAMLDLVADFLARLERDSDPGQRH